MLYTQTRLVVDLGCENQAVIFYLFFVRFGEKKCFKSFFSSIDSTAKLSLALKMYTAL